jgi:hypothetical protein
MNQVNGYAGLDGNLPAAALYQPPVAKAVGTGTN